MKKISLLLLSVLLTNPCFAAIESSPEHNTGGTISFEDEFYPLNEEQDTYIRHNLSAISNALDLYKVYRDESDQEKKGVSYPSYLVCCGFTPKEEEHNINISDALKINITRFYEPLPFGKFPFFSRYIPKVTRSTWRL